jgi:hypothetical protein
MTEEILDDRKVEEALQFNPDDEKPKGHSLFEIYREVSRLSAMNFFIQAMTEKYPGITLYELKANLPEYVMEMINDNTITDTLAANLLQIEVEEVQEQLKSWKLKKR